MPVKYTITEINLTKDIKQVESLKYRKCRYLSMVTLSEGLISIGDASFSCCVSLKQIVIPASVEYIGVAAFCKSGLEYVTFKAKPTYLERNIFIECKSLKKIIVPKGCKDWFAAKLDISNDLISEEGELVHAQPTTAVYAPAPPRTSEVFKARRCQFAYNQQSFNWRIGDLVNLQTFFSDQIVFNSDPSFQFRKKALFIFMKSRTASLLNRSDIYNIPVSFTFFSRKYNDKYINRTPRIIVFECDDGKSARLFDEVKLISINKNSISVQSILRL